VKHDIPFSTVEKDFANRDEALIWIISTQVARFSQQDPSCQNGTMQKSTALRLSEAYNVSPRTIMRDAQLADAIAAISMTSSDAKRQILAGKTRISKKKLLELSAGPEEDVIEVQKR